MEGCVHRGYWGGNMKIKKGFLMDYKCRGNWYTAFAKSSQVKQSVNAVRVWLNMLERCRPPCPTPSLHRSQKKLGNFSAEPKSKSEHAPLSQHFGWDWDRFEVCGHFNCNGHPWETRLSLSLFFFLCFFSLFTTKCYVHLATPSAYLITLLGIAIGADLQLFHIFDSTRPSSGCIDTFSAIFTVCFGFCFITNWVWPQLIIIKITFSQLFIVNSVWRRTNFLQSPHFIVYS